MCLAQIADVCVTGYACIRTSVKSSSHCNLLPFRFTAVSKPALRLFQNLDRGYVLFTLKNKLIRFLFARTYSICFVVIKPHNKKGISRTVITVNIAFYSYYYFDINKLYNKLEKTALNRRSRSDRPRFDAHVRWTPPLPLASPR